MPNFNEHFIYAVIIILVISFYLWLRFKFKPLKKFINKNNYIKTIYYIILTLLIICLCICLINWKNNGISFFKNII